MSPQGLIDKYYPEANELRHILLTHSRSVADKALWIADRHPELSLDRDFLYEAAMLHDIGIFLTDADGIYCFGDKPYICHGYLGPAPVCLSQTKAYRGRSRTGGYCCAKSACSSPGHASGKYGRAGCMFCR